MKVTCTIMPISDKSRFAYAHVWSVCVITRSLLVTFANECLTLICRKIRKKEGPKKKKRININYRYKHFDSYQTAIIHHTRSIKYRKTFFIDFKIQHLIQGDKFTPLSATVIPALKIRNLIEVHFKCWLRLIPFSQYSPLNPGGHKHRYPLSVNPDWQVALFSQ